MSPTPNLNIPPNVHNAPGQERALTYQKLTLPHLVRGLRFQLQVLVLLIADQGHQHRCLRLPLQHSLNNQSYSLCAQGLNLLLAIGTGTLSTDAVVLRSARTAVIISLVLGTVIISCRELLNRMAKRLSATSTTPGFA